MLSRSTQIQHGLNSRRPHKRTIVVELDDKSKAFEDFDTVNHRKLMEKSKELGKEEFSQLSI